jgi:hypothetical protein
LRDNHYFSAIIKGNDLKGFVTNRNTSSRSPVYGNKIQNKKFIEDSEEDSSSELPLIVNKKEAIKAKK